MLTNRGLAEADQLEARLGNNSVPKIISQNPRLCFDQGNDGHVNNRGADVY